MFRSEPRWIEAIECTDSEIVEIHALAPLCDDTVYCAAKAGADMLTRSRPRPG